VWQEVKQTWQFADLKVEAVDSFISNRRDPFFFAWKFEFPQIISCFFEISTNTDVLAISFLRTAWYALPLQLYGSDSFSNNNNVPFVISGPKTVKLFSNKEHMGFRYATSCLELFGIWTLQNSLSFIFSLTTYLCNKWQQCQWLSTNGHSWAILRSFDRGMTYHPTLKYGWWPSSFLTSQPLLFCSPWWSWPFFPAE
jgi:hypothetical protein